MKTLRSVLLCAAVAGAMSAAAAEPVGTLRVKSLSAVLDVVRDGAALAGQPFAAVMAESMLRSQIAQTGLEVREDDPLLFAMLPNPAEDGASGEAGMVGLMMDPPAMAFAVPTGPLPAELLEKILDTTNAPAPGEWASNEDGDLSYSYRDGYALFALKEQGRALAEALVAAKPARPGALLEMTIDEPAEFRKRMELGDAKEEVMAAAYDALAERFGLPGFGDKVRILSDAAEKIDRETERFVVDAWFDATNGLVVAADRVAREGSDLAARIAAAPALDPAALPGVPAGAPVWSVQSAFAAPDADMKALTEGIRALFEGPAPSGDAAATAQRAAAVRMIDANLAALPSIGAAAFYATVDADGRPAFVSEERLLDPAPSRALLDSQVALLETFPSLASNGVAVVREGPGAFRLDVSTADAFFALARLGYALKEFEEEDDGSDLWIDDEEDDEEEDDGDDEDDGDEVSNVAEVSNVPETDEDEPDDDNEFDEEEARGIAKQIADAIGETIVVRDEIAEDGSSEKLVVSAPGARIPAAQGSPDLGPALELGKAFLPAGARPWGASFVSVRSLFAAYLPALLRLDAASDDPMDEDDIASLKAFAEGDADFRFRMLAAAEGRSLSVVFAIPRADIEALAKLVAEAAEKAEASFDFDDDDDVDIDDDDDDECNPNVFPNPDPADLDDDDDDAASAADPAA